jgi:hypothetical protein
MFSLILVSLQNQGSLFSRKMYFKFGDNAPHFFNNETWKKLDSASFPLELVVESTIDDPWIFPRFITNSLGDEIELSYDVLDTLENLSRKNEISLDYVTLNHILFFRFNSLNKFLRNQLVKK